jgi:hypothetical protein
VRATTEFRYGSAPAIRHERRRQSGPAHKAALQQPLISVPLITAHGQKRPLECTGFQKRTGLARSQNRGTPTVLSKDGPRNGVLGWQSFLVKFSSGFSFVYLVISLTVMFDQELAEAREALALLYSESVHPSTAQDS